MSTVSSSTTTTTTAAASSSTKASPTPKSVATTQSSSAGDIDWNALIEVAVNAKLTKASSIDVKVSDNELKIAAYNEAKNLLSSLQDAAQTLRAPSGSSMRAVDSFQARSAYLSASGGASATSTLSATIDPGADLGSYKLEVIQLAEAHKVASALQSSKTSDLGLSGTISLGVEGQSNIDITIKPDMSVMEIAELINKTKTTSQVQASVVQVSASEFRLVLSGVQTGHTISASSVSGDDVLSSLGLTDAAGAFANELQEAKQAILKIDDIEVVRATNEISDVLNGTKIYLYQTTPPGGSITLEVGANVSKVKSSVMEMVDAYNAYRDFAITQQTLPSKNNDPALFGDSTMRTLNTAIGTVLSANSGENVISRLGLTYDINNRLVVDEDKLDNLLLTDLNAVQDILSFKMTASNTDLQLLGRGAGTPKPFTLDIKVDATGAMSGATVNGEEGLFTVSGTRLVGKAGTIYEGYSFVYAAGADATIDVSFKTGVAEQLYNIANGATNTNSGSLSMLVNELTEYNTELTTRSDNIRARAEEYRSTLTYRYAQYQASIASAESMLEYLQTLIDTWNATS